MDKLCAKNEAYGQLDTDHFAQEQKEEEEEEEGGGRGEGEEREDQGGCRTAHLILKEGV